jgi:hypothetical protein
MVGLNPLTYYFDQIPSSDLIYDHYVEKEQWVVKKVNFLNKSLEELNKPQIKLGFIDVLSPDILYGNSEKVLVVDYQLRYPHLITSPCFKIPDSVYGIYYMQPRPWHRNITKNFNCFINRNDPIRQSWFYLLYHRDLLNHGYVSFSGRSRMHSSLDHYELFDQIHNETLNSFDSIYHDIRKLIPYKNFHETGDLCDTILSTKFSIILETYFERTDALTFSEKIFRALQVPRPWLLFHATNSVSILRELGFYVYDDIIDHSYDKFDTTHYSIERQESILEQAQELLNLEVTDSMLAHWEEMTKKNCEILKNMNMHWQHDCEDTILKAYDLALTL